MSTSMLGKRSLKIGSTPREGSSQRWPAETIIVTLPVSLSSVYQPGPLVSASAWAARVPRLLAAAAAAVAAVAWSIWRRVICSLRWRVCSIVCL